MKSSSTKRVFDLCVSICILPILLTLTLIAACLYSLFERENPFFLQKRVGRYGRNFTLIKLRTMKVSTKHQATHTIDKSSVTTTGSFFRKTKLDEIPQIFNVIIGDMSLVGPRPCLPTQNELVEERKKRDVLDYLPGVTGLAQIQGIDMSDPVLLAKQDHQYCKNISIKNDIYILLKTISGSGQGDKVSNKADV